MTFGLFRQRRPFDLCAFSFDSYISSFCCIPKHENAAGSEKQEKEDEGKGEVDVPVHRYDHNYKKQAQARCAHPYYNLFL